VEEVVPHAQKNVPQKKKEVQVVRRKQPVKNLGKSCVKCKKGFVPKRPFFKFCDDCHIPAKKEVPIESHAKKKKRNKWKDYDYLNDATEKFEQLPRKELRFLQDLDNVPLRGKAWADEDWDEVDMTRDIEWNSAKPSKVSNNKDIERHAKIPVNSICNNVVKVGTREETVGYAYMVSHNAFVCPSHYKNVEVCVKGKQKYDCKLVSTLKDPNGVEGVSVYMIDGNVAVSKIALNVPSAEFSGLIIAPGFSQVSSVEYKPDTALLAYTAESTFGDCGQPVVDAVRNCIVGFHIGVNKTARVSKLALALALTPSLLRQLTDKVQGLGF
jgi:hypothetical protein